MIAKAQTKLGGVAYQFEFDDKDEMEAMAKAITLGNPPTYCNLCKVTGPENFSLETNKDKEANIYVKVRCSCGATASLGQYKAGGYFWHDFEMYVKKEKDNGQS